MRQFSSRQLFSHSCATRASLLYLAAPLLSTSLIMTSASGNQPSLHGLLSSLVSSSRDLEVSSPEHHPDVTSITMSPSSISTTQEAAPKPSDLDKIIRHMEEKELEFAVKRDRSLIFTTMTGNNGSYRVICDLKEEDKILIVYVFSPVKVPPNKRLDIAEYITRANYGVMIGNFEMDFTDGELRYKGGIDYSGGELVDGMIEQLIGKSAYTMNRYFPGIMRIIYGDVSAKDAMAEIEPNQAHGEAAEALAEALVQAITGGDIAMSTSDSPPDDSTAATTDTPIVVATPTSEQ